MHTYFHIITRFNLSWLRGISMLLALGVVVACAPAERDYNRASGNAKSEWNTLKQRWKGYLMPYEAKEVAAPVIPSSYCYKAMQDVVCYKDPQPGMESRLVGYQEPPLIQQPIDVNASANGQVTSSAAPVGAVASTPGTIAPPTSVAVHAVPGTADSAAIPGKPLASSAPTGTASAAAAANSGAKIGADGKASEGASTSTAASASAAAKKAPAKAKVSGGKPTPLIGAK